MGPALSVKQDKVISLGTGKEKKMDAAWVKVPLHYLQIMDIKWPGKMLMSLENDDT
jgi:Cu/Ag efflux protein CusF